MPVSHTEVLLRFDGAELARVTLTPGEYVIGRSPEADIYADTALLSRKHAGLCVRRDHITLEDLGSSNGTFVDDQRITDSARVSPGQAARLGDVQLVIESAPVPVPPRGVPQELLARRPYAIGDQIARGVLAAQQSALERPVAMKVMLNDADPDAVRRFVEEAQVTGQLTHPNIVPIHELGVDERGQVFYTMKLVRGITLKKVIQLLGEGVEGTKKKYPLPALLTIFQKACDAVAFAHAHAVIHRDLKPENIMLGDYGEVLVMDWGLAKKMKDEEVSGSAEGPTSSSLPPVRDRTLHPSSFSSTLEGTIMGTPAYMAPEQARGEISALDARSDIYALGAILFELLHLRRTVTGRTAAEILDKIGRGEVAAPEAGRIPDSLAAVVRKAMALEQDARYATVEHLQRDLTAYQNGFATTAEQASLGRQLLLALKRHKIVATIGAIALFIIALVVTVAFVRVTGEKRRAERALADLRQAAPTFAAQATALMGEQKLGEAIDKLDFALAIDPQNPDYLQRRADYLLAATRLDEAIQAYRKLLAVREDLISRENLALCEKLRTRATEPEALREIIEALNQQKRHLEAASLSARLGLGSGATLDLLREVLRPLEALPEWGKHPSRVNRLSDGQFSLSLSFLPITDISFLAKLRGQPINVVYISDTLVRDISPLADFPLRRLEAENTKVQDLSPLTGRQLVMLKLSGAPIESIEVLRAMPITTLRLSACVNIRDFTPLIGMPLRNLIVDSTMIVSLDMLRGAPLETLNAQTCSRLVDIEGLRGLPLRSVNFWQSNSIRDLSPLLDCPTLEDIVVPDAPGLSKLRSLPNLKTISHLLKAKQPAAEFWAEYDAKQKAAGVK